MNEIEKPSMTPTCESEIEDGYLELYEEIFEHQAGISCSDTKVCKCKSIREEMITHDISLQVLDRGQEGVLGIMEPQDEPGQRDFHKLYSIGPRLGKGGYGTVHAGRRQQDNLEIAIKIIEKHGKFIKMENSVPLEVILMRQLTEVPGVIHLLDYFDEPDAYTLIVERVNNSEDLYDYINNNGPLSECLALHLFKQVVNITNACHQKVIVHRDIKDENILIDTNTFRIKLIDFGAGAYINDGYYTDFWGTLVYAPPEYITSGYYTADGLTVWCLGILLYAMVCQEIPFEEYEDIIHEYEEYKTELYLYIGHAAPQLSYECKHLILCCLTRVEGERITLHEISSHPWLD